MNLDELANRVEVARSNAFQARQDWEAKKAGSWAKVASASYEVDEAEIAYQKACNQKAT